MFGLHKLPVLNFLAVGGDAAFGAWARWFLDLALNPLFVTLPLGTLAANVIVGYLIGLAVGLFALTEMGRRWFAWKLLDHRSDHVE